jgi:hypothetical protein
MASHRSVSKAKPTLFHKWVNENGGWGNFDMVLVEDCPCENKEQLHRRERYWIEALKPELNSRLPTRTNKEWYEDNREKVASKSKVYYQENKEVIQKRNKGWFKNHPGAAAEYTRAYRERNYDEVKEREKEWQRAYREKNKDAINARRRELRVIKANQS